MERIYHLVLRSTWLANPAQDYRTESLSAEGFIHCSQAQQMAASANRFYANAGDLLVLEIEPAGLTSSVKYEAAGSGELFPHVYGPINRQAVVAVHAMKRDGNGKWVFPE